MSETYEGSVSVEGSDDTMYLELTIDDVDAPDWVGTGAPDGEVPGVTAVGEYSVKLIDNGHSRRGQRATAVIEFEVEDAVLRLHGRTPFA
jgi:hypothetical protein